MGETGSPIHGLPSWVPNWALDVEPTLLYDLDDRLSCLPKFNHWAKKAVVVVSIYVEDGPIECLHSNTRVYLGFGRPRENL